MNSSMFAEIMMQSGKVFHFLIVDEKKSDKHRTISIDSLVRVRMLTHGYYRKTTSNL